jgi:hypothetical protein
MVAMMLRYRRWCLLLAVGCLCGLVGCQGGGGNTVSGTVYATTRTALLTRQYHAVPAPWVQVSQIYVNNDGTHGYPYDGVTTLTDYAGYYRLTLPPGIELGPQVNVVAGPVDDPSMAAMATGPTVDIRPMSQAVRDVLYTTARGLSVPLGSLNGNTVRAFVAAATEAGWRKPLLHCI